MRSRVRRPGSGVATASSASWRARSAASWSQTEKTPRGGPSAAAHRAAGRSEIKKSERVQKEKQAPLFEELPDTPLPPLKLLDEARREGERGQRRDAGIHLAA